MFYLYEDRVFIGRRNIPNTATEAEIKKLTAIHPMTNAWQYLDAEGGIIDVDNLTYTLLVKNIRRYAKCDHEWVVQELTDELRDEELVPVPYGLNTRIACGWIWDGETFAPPDLNSYLESERKKALLLIADKHAEMLTLATGGETFAERDTWVIKEAAARDVLAGGDGSGVLRPVGNETISQLADKILKKSQAYKALVGIADKIKRTTEKAIESLALNSLDDLATLDATLTTAQQQAAEAAMAAVNQ